MHDILNIQVARRKEKVAKFKLEEISKTRFDKKYLQQKEMQCKYCGDKWLPRHECNNSKSYRHQDKKESTSIILFDNDKNKKPKKHLLMCQKMGPRS